MDRLVVFLSALGLLVVTAVLLAWPTQWLWNNVLIGAVDGVHPIGFWQALGINILFNMLFKNNK
jgi:hypothetical protein